MNHLEFILCSYPSGAFPVGLLLTKAAGLGNILTTVSSIVGAADRLRTVRKDLAAGALAPPGSVPAATCVSLRKCEAAERAANAPTALRLCGPSAEPTDFDATAPPVSALDLFVTIARGLACRSGS